MTIDFELDVWKLKTRELFALNGVEEVIRGELQKIVDRNRDKAIPNPNWQTSGQ